MLFLASHIHRDIIINLLSKSNVSQVNAISAFHNIINMISSDGSVASKAPIALTLAHFLAVTLKLMAGKF